LTYGEREIVNHTLEAAPMIEGTTAPSPDRAPIVTLLSVIALGYVGFFAAILAQAV
jgi:hypothetical protein